MNNKNTVVLTRFKTMLIALLAVILVSTLALSACGLITFVQLQSITAEYNGSELQVGDVINKDDVAVTAQYTDGTSKKVTSFTLGECDTSTDGDKTVTVTYSENGVTKTTTFTVTVVPVVLQSITAVYNGVDVVVDGTLNKSDIAVTASYSDGSSKAVSDFTVGECDTSTVGDKTVTITYTEDDVTKTDEITVTVVARLESIEVDYIGGDVVVKLSLDDTAITVTAHYSDGSSKTVDGYTLSQTTFNEVGTKTVTVTYVENGVTQTTTFSVNVIAATLERIEAKYTGGKVLLDEQPDVSKLVVTAYYNNGESKVVTAVNVGIIDSSTEGNKNWEISYTEDGVTKSDTVVIVVTEVKEPQEGIYDVNVISNENLSIHFLELGNKYTGDCVYIKAGDTDILIDAGSRYDSATAITNYVDRYCTDGVLEYVIATHAHQDHIAGFYGNGSTTGIFDHYVCENIIQFARTEATTQVYSRYVEKRDAEVAAGANLYTALDCVNNANGAQKVYNLTEDGSITMEILYQKYYETKLSGENNYSVCLMISQGDNHYLFTGDLEEEGEKSLVESNPNLPEMELWKGGHHGSYTAGSTELLEKIQPKCICICTCMGTTEYTTGANVFPAQPFINRIAPYTDRVYVTTHMVNYSAGTYQPANGNIVFACTNGQITMYFTGNNLKLKDTDWFKASRTCPSAWKTE